MLWPLCLAALIAAFIGSASAATWRSALYPENWTPADKDAQGRFLHDFSYAGYHLGQAAIPDNPPGLTYTVTDAPYLADNSGSSDATAAIQQAIDDAGAGGGGIVYLPAGTYNVAPGVKSYALRLADHGVVLRGAGTNLTYLCNTDTDMRSKKVILVQPTSGDWHSPLGGSEILATADIPYPTRTIPLASVAGLATGDTIIVRAECTDDFIADHGMTGKWTSALQGPTICRRITAINVESQSITIDVPTRYYMKTRDNARIYKVADMLQEVAVEDLSIGMLQNPIPGMGDNAYNTPGTGAYEVHASHAIKFKHVRNGWVQRVATYRPSANAGNYHTLSNVLLVDECTGVTIRHCLFMNPQYEGGGGNGYGFTLSGNDCLITACEAISCRHNYDFKSMRTSGNVIHKSVTRAARLSSDFHMHLSMGNLFDSMTLNGDWLQGVYRPYGTIEHGHATTESVFWNTHGEDSGTAVESRQWGWGYVIGTSGGRSSVTRGTSYNTAPEDFLEGQGSGDTLEPQSLFEDQFIRRLQGVIVNAGEDLEGVATNAAMPLDGSVYSYMAAASPGHEWSQVGGPPATIADGQSVDTTVACPSTGTYTFRLTAWEGSVTNHDDIIVDVRSLSIGTLSSKDSIVGRGQASAPALDYYPDDANSISGVSGSTTTSTRNDRNVVLGYALPTLPAGTTVSNATLRFEITGARDHNNQDPSLHVYLLNTSNPDSSGTTFYFHGASDLNADVLLVGSTYIAAGTSSENYADDQHDQSYDLAGAALSLLQSLYGGDHVPDQPEVFFRFNLNITMPPLTGLAYERYIIDLADDESSLEIAPTERLWSATLFLFN